MTFSTLIEAKNRPLRLDADAFARTCAATSSAAASNTACSDAICAAINDAFGLTHATPSHRALAASAVMTMRWWLVRRDMVWIMGSPSC